MIVDTNILIDYLRDKEEAIRFLEASTYSFSISVVSITELYAGLRGSRELHEVRNFLSSFQTHIVDDETARIAGEYLNQYSKSHRVGIADALIAATATLSGEQLSTLNIKDFPMLSEVLRPY